MSFQSAIRKQVARERKLKKLMPPFVVHSHNSSNPQLNEINTVKNIYNYLRAKAAATAILLLSLAAVQAQLTNLTYAWNPLPANQLPATYKFYELVGSNWVYLGSSLTTNYVVTNQNITLEHTYGVTASNSPAFGESPKSVPYRIQAAPTAPQGLNLSRLPPLIAPVGGTIEFSTDLVSWNTESLLLAPVSDFNAAALGGSSAPLDALVSVSYRTKDNSTLGKFLRNKPPATQIPLIQ